MRIAVPAAKPFAAVYLREKFSASTKNPKSRQAHRQNNKGIIKPPHLHQVQAAAQAILVKALLFHRNGQTFGPAYRFDNKRDKNPW